MKSVLFISPHTDDVELSCGGTIARFVETGISVRVLCLADGRSLYPDIPLFEEFNRSMEVLGIEWSQCEEFPIREFSSERQAILSKFICLRDSISLGAVFIPSRHDTHQDHKVVYQEAIRAFKYCNVYEYEQPWNHSTFEPQFFASLQRPHVEKKLESLQCYVSQAHRPYMQKNHILAQLTYRSFFAKTSWAEAFQVRRIII